MNLRADDSFVEDEGWHRAAERYAKISSAPVQAKNSLSGIGVGYNTPVIIKYPFWRMTVKNPMPFTPASIMGKRCVRRKLKAVHLH